MFNRSTASFSWNAFSGAQRNIAELTDLIGWKHAFGDLNLGPARLLLSSRDRFYRVPHTANLCDFKATLPVVDCEPLFRPFRTELLLSLPVLKSATVSEMILMGTGTSVGVPVVGCDCDVCRSSDVRNHRTRSGVLVRAPEGEFVIDTSPELRLQLLASHASLIKAALFTHAHADHIMGLDDLRIFGFRLEKQLRDLAAAQAEQMGQSFDEDDFTRRGEGRIPLFCEQPVEDDIRRVFHYAFIDPKDLPHRFSAPRLSFHRVVPGEPFSVLGLPVLPIRLMHGRLPIVGFRIGDVAFCTDVSGIPAESRRLLQGLDTLVIGALRYDLHPTHMNVAQAVKWSQRLKPRRTILTHMAHDLDYARLAEELPDGIEPGYDGLTIEIVGLADESVGRCLA